MQKSNLINDLSSLLSVQKLPLCKMVEISNKCISYDLYETRLLNDDTFSVDIGIGTIVMHISDNEIKYRFNPSSALEQSLMDTMENGAERPLIDEAEKALVNKLLSTYKELF